MTANAALVVFGIAAAVTVYVYFGYPALLYVLARVRTRSIARGELTPSMTLLIPVHNEEQVVAEKIANSLSVDYPAELLEVIFISDGSTDRTGELVRASGDPRVRLIEIPRSGKAAALNAGARAAVGEVLVFTDANVELDREALRHIGRCLSDPEVGGVAGRKTYVVRSGGDTTERGENLYWKWDQWQKELESAIGSVFAADGSLYAIRRPLFAPIDDPAQADDIAISTRVVLQGRRLVFEPAAVAREEAPAEGSEEFRRKIRVTNHSVRALLNLGSALWTSGFYSVELLSHKLIRHLIPFFLLLLLSSSVFLAAVGWNVFQIMFALQIAFYTLALVGTALRHRPAGEWKVLAVPYYFCLVNAAAFLGVLSILRGRRVRAWEPRSS